MIRFADLVEALLSELTLAQHKSEVFGAELAASLSEHEILRHLPVRTYGIGGSSMTLQFAVGKVVTDTPKPGQIAGSVIDQVAERVTRQLHEHEALVQPFALSSKHLETWTQEVGPKVYEAFREEAPHLQSVEAMSKLYGSLVKSHYALGLLSERAKLPLARAREAVAAGHADLLGATAARLFREELQAVFERERPVPPESGGAPTLDSTGTAVYVLVEADELKQAVAISSITLELDETGLHRPRVIRREEEDRDETEASAQGGDAQAQQGGEA